MYTAINIDMSASINNNAIIDTQWKLKSQYINVLMKTYLVTSCYTFKGYILTPSVS